MTHLYNIYNFIRLRHHFRFHVDIILFYAKLNLNFFENHVPYIPIIYFYVYISEHDKNVSFSNTKEEKKYYDMNHNSEPTVV